MKWHQFGFLPGWFGFCPDEKTWKRQMRKMGKKDVPYPTSDGRTTTFERSGRNGFAIIVTVAEHLDKEEDSNAVVALIVHEAVHVFQQVCEDIGERRPSPEMEAYAIQHITRHLLADYSVSRKYTGGKGERKKVRQQSG